MHYLFLFLLLSVLGVVCLKIADDCPKVKAIVVCKGTIDDRLHRPVSILIKFNNVTDCLPLIKSPDSTST